MGKVYKRNKIWYIDYTVFGKRIRERVGPNRKLADVILGEKERAIMENRYPNIKKQEKIKFEDFADHYLEVYCKPNHKSFKSDINNIKALKRFFSGKYLYEITPEDIERFKGERTKEGMTPATVNRSLAWLKSLFNRAIEWKKIEDNPVRKVKLFKENNQRLRYLEEEEFFKLLDKASEHLKPILIVAYNTGMRKGEILNLKWHDVDFKRNIIYLLNTKNGERREIPMNDWVREILTAIREHSLSSYIFCNKDGKPYGDIKKSFYTACKKSGIMNFRFHDLRHTFASQLVMSGMSLNTVRELLGHKTSEMTLRYAHLSPDFKKKAVEVLAQKYYCRFEKFGTNLAQIEDAKITGNFALSEHIDNKELVV